MTKNRRSSSQIRQHKDQSSQRRFVYIMERVSGRTWGSFFTGKREIKIGVAIDSQRRQKEVDRAIPGNIRLIDEYLCDDANAVESAVHEKFKPRKFIPKNAGKAGGRTEWFRLTGDQVADVRRTLKKASVSPGVDIRVPVWLLIIIFAVVTTFILHFIKNQNYGIQ